MLAINGTSDHVHLLTGLHTTQSMSELMRDVKANSSRWINEKGFLKSRFEWQEGYGAFSYAKSNVSSVIQYIARQKEHHLKMGFAEEYKRFLEKFEIEFDERYVFHEPE